MDGSDSPISREGVDDFASGGPKKGGLSYGAALDAARGDDRSWERV